MRNVLQKLLWLVMLLPATYLFILWNKIPAIVPMHFDMQGNVDRYGSKDELLWLIAGLTMLNAIVYLIITNVYKIDPKKYASQNKSRLQKIGFYVSLYLSAVWIILIYEIGNNDVSKTMKFTFIAMGLLFALLGNNMYNIQPNYFAGIRLPWTLESEDNWRKTHHLAGRLWFFGGITFAVIALLLTSQFIGYIGAFILTVLIAVPILYSYNLYRKQVKKI